MHLVRKPATARASLPSSPELSELVFEYERAFEEANADEPEEAPVSGIVVVNAPRSDAAPAAPPRLRAVGA
jgi:hypothetical protein